MKDEPIQTIKRLEDSLLDTSGESKVELCNELETSGVDVNGFLLSTSRAKKIRFSRSGQ